MAVSAAELPEMSRATGGATEEVNAKLRERIERSSRRMAFFVVPSAAAFLFIGDVVASTLLQTGRFTPADSRYVWYLLMGSAVGLVSSTVGRLYSSAFYALKDPGTPLRFAMVACLPGRRHGLGARPVPAGRAGAAAVPGRRLHHRGQRPAWPGWRPRCCAARLAQRVGGRVGPPPGLLPKLWACAGAAGVLALGVKGR